MPRVLWMLPALLGAALTAESAPPLRVVSLAPNLTDIVREIGAEETLVAATPFCDVPPDLRRVPGGMQPEAEVVLALEPDLVLASSITPATTLRQLRNLGIRAEVFHADSLDGIRTAMAKLASIFGKSAPAGGPDPSPATSRSAVLLFGADTGYSAGCGTHAHEILSAAGLRNIAADASGPWPQLGEEFLLAANPEVLVVADYGDADRETLLDFLRKHPVRKHLDAVRAGRVVVLPARAFSIPGPAALEAGKRLRTEVEKL
jgi:iron complex transport system substrate-binding protein